MAAYGQSIPQVMAWTLPQFKLMARYRDIRERSERKWQLVLSAGMMSEEAVETLWAQLEGDEIEFLPSGGSGSTTSSTAGIGKQSHAIDSKGNVIARGAPLLSDIALGKSRAPRLIPINVIDHAQDAKDGDA